MSCAEDERAEALARLQTRLGYRFRSPELLERALTQRSAAHESGAPASAANEALEFLGDAVVSLALAEHLVRAWPGRTEGEYSELRARVVSQEALAGVASQLDLGDLLRLGRGEEASGGRRRESLLADALEALFGAALLDGGPSAVESLFRALLAAPIRTLATGAADERRDPKSRLQELLQLGGNPPPEYEVVTAEGPDHEPRFRVVVRHGGRVLGEGSGPSRRVAERIAARTALARLAGGTSF